MAYSQAGRPIKIDTPLGPDVLLLEEFSGSEYVSQPFQFRLHAVSTSSSLPLDGLLQKPVVVTLLMVNDSPRYIHGIVCKAVQLERAAGLATYELEIVPWLWFLALISDCRIFQNKSTPDIIEQIFQEQGFQDYVLKLTASYEPREYCVQYRESSLNFVSRLMEEEGIFYFFEHTESKHNLIISDMQTAFTDCPGNPTVRYDVSAAALREDDIVQSLNYLRSVQSRTISLTDYDFEKPSVKLDVRATSARYDVYDYPGLYLIRDDGERLAKIRLEKHEAQQLLVEGASNCRQFVPGYKFMLQEHYRDDINDSYKLLSVTHSASATSYRSDRNEPFNYLNSFIAMPDSVPYRPSLSARKPTVLGSQTAVVVGKKGEEIWVDKYGRVKVQFHWDREGKNDENSSCWVRVSQTWAGKAWGFIQIPRIGQEVVVDFLEGDPDRPLIIGRVYNAEQVTPYSLPGDQTFSGVKSRSTKTGGSENYNELVFEDKKGQEFVRLHAEKDMQEYVEKNTYEYVGQDRNLIVDGSQAEKVKGDKHLTLQGEQRENVSGDVSLQVGGSHHEKVGQLFALQSGQEIHIQGGMKVIIEAGMELSLIGPGGFVDIGPAGVTIQGNMVLINSGGSKGSGSDCQPKAPKEPQKAGD